MGADFSLSPEMAAGAVYYGAIIAAVGACAVRFFLASALLHPDARDRLERAAAASGVAAVLVAFAAQLLRAWTHTLAAFGLADALVWSNLRLIAIESRWGGDWKIQLTATAAALLAAIAVRRRLPGAWIAFAVAVLAMCATLPIIGHAAGSPGRVILHAAHVTGAGVWLGSLAVLYRSARGSGDLTALRMFSTTAFSGSATVFLSGLIASSLYVGTATHLIDSAYGRVLLLKIALVVGAASCGFRNWRHLHGRANAAKWDKTLGTVRLELAFGIAIVAVTGILTELPHP